jgi:hypothetical protein
MSEPKPRPVRNVLYRARVRYRAAQSVYRPNLDQPASCCGLFPIRDLVFLAKVCRWPLNQQDISYLRSAG